MVFYAVTISSPTCGMVFLSSAAPLGTNSFTVPEEVTAGSDNGAWIQTVVLASAVSYFNLNCCRSMVEISCTLMRPLVAHTLDDGANL